MFVLTLKKRVAKAFFMNMTKNNKNIFPKKCFCVFKGAFFGRNAIQLIIWQWIVVQFNLDQ